MAVYGVVFVVCLVRRCIEPLGSRANATECRARAASKLAGSSCRRSWIIGRKIKTKYDGASKVLLNKRGLLQVTDRRYKAPTAQDMVYLAESPDYCLPNRKIGSLGMPWLLSIAVFQITQSIIAQLIIAPLIIEQLIIAPLIINWNDKPGKKSCDLRKKFMNEKASITGLNPFRKAMRWIYIYISIYE